MDVLHVSLGTFEYFEAGYFVVRGVAGAVATIESTREPLEKAAEFFRGPFGIIAVRDVDYDLDFELYRKLNADPMVVSVAVVIDAEITSKRGESEQDVFQDTEYGVFNDFDLAREWTIERRRSFMERTESGVDKRNRPPSAALGSSDEPRSTPEDRR